MKKMRWQIFVLAALGLAICAGGGWLLLRSGPARPHKLAPAFLLDGGPPAADAWRPEANVQLQAIAALESPPEGDQAFRTEASLNREGEGEEDNPRERRSLFVWQRSYPLDTMADGAQLRLEAIRQVELQAQGENEDTQTAWVNIGPAPMKNSNLGDRVQSDVSGRVTALAVDPRNSNVVYLGAALGGVWKTTNGGDAWRPLTDNQPSLATGALALAPSAPDTIYVGTGEANMSDSYYGMGVLKSTDGGSSWRQFGADLFTGLGFSALVVHPTNPNIVFASTSSAIGVDIRGPQTPSRGIFKSTDGGQTWIHPLGCANDGCLGTSDLVIDVTNPNVLYAAAWRLGIWKSTDGGVVWTKLTTGLPSSNFGRIALAISRSNPNLLYAGYELSIPGQYEGAGIFRTTNGGTSWQQLPVAPNYCREQCNYDNVVAIHPTNPNIVYFGGQANYQWEPYTVIKEVVVRTTDAGSTWWDMSPGSNPATTLHPDMHAIVFDPQNPNTMWIGNDGGVWKTTDGGNAWINRNTNLATLQFTGIALHPTDPNVAFGGMQDNNKAKTAGSIEWTAMDAGDGGRAAIDPFKPNFFYGTRYRYQFQRNDQGGSSPADDWPLKINGINQNDPTLFYSPFALDPSTEGVLYWGTYRVYRTANRGESWTLISGDLTSTQNGLISTIAVAPSDPRTIYVGTNDGNVQVSANQGGSWTNTRKAPLPNRWVSEVIVAPGDARKAYVVFNGFNTHTPGQPGHVFRTTNGGGAWQDISSNLPDIPVLAIALDRDAPGVLYIGTDVGVFRSTNDGGSWQPFNTGMANVPVFDLELNPNTDVLIAGTHGRSVYRLIANAPPTPTPPPTATPTRGPTATPTRTPTPVTPAGNRRVFLPNIERGNAPPPTQPPATALPTLPPTPTATPRPSRLPTATPTSGPTPTPTTAPSLRVYYDDFADPDSGWEIGVDGDCEQGYDTGLYYLAANAADALCIASAPAAAQINGVFEVKAAKISAEDGSIYGLVFGMNRSANPTQFHVLWVDPWEQSYRLQRFNNGAWVNLTPWRLSDAIATDSDMNVLKARRLADRFHLYINDVLVEATPFAAAGNGFAGLILWAAYDAPTAITLFDDFKITQPTTVLNDDFNNANSGWPVGSTSACQADYFNGGYVTAAQAGFACAFRFASDPSPNGQFEVTGVKGAGSIYPTAYGIMVAEDGNFDAFYTFLVNPDSREYVLALYDASGFSALTWDEAGDDAWTPSAAIRPGSTPNRLRLERDSTEIRLFIEDTLIESVSDDTLLGLGYFGVVNWGSDFDTSSVLFDNFKLTAWDEPFWVQAQAGASAPLQALPRAPALPAKK